MTTNEIRDMITTTLWRESRGDWDLGLSSADDAAAFRDAIADANMTDDDALRAYDLLHNRAVFGHAF
jgi:hypothetical protein